MWKVHRWLGRNWAACLQLEVVGAMYSRLCDDATARQSSGQVGVAAADNALYAQTAARVVQQGQQTGYIQVTGNYRSLEIVVIDWAQKFVMQNPLAKCSL